MASTKQEIWLNEYLECWNATEAARRAGYKWPNKSGPANLQALEDEIKQRVEEKTMSANEALVLLDRKVRFDFSPYVLSDRYGIGIDIKKLIADGHGDMIRKVYQTENGPRIEFTDPDDAHDKLMKVLGLTDKGPAGSQDDPVHHRITYIKENRPDGD